MEQKACEESIYGKIIAIYVQLRITLTSPKGRREPNMNPRHIFITQYDKDRLDELISVAEQFGGFARADLHDLQGELERAKVVPSTSIPRDVVTMNSKVLLRDVSTSEQMTYTLVFPKDANIDAGAISVLAPIGTAILGYRQGDVVEWSVPSGKRRICIEKVLYQPEAAGDFHL